MSNYSKAGEWDTGSLWGKWTFSVPNEMMKVGRTRALEYDDLLQIPSDDESAKLMRTLKKNYRNSKKFWFIPRLLIALLKTSGTQNILLIILCIMSESAFRVALPISLIYLLNELTTGSSANCYIWAGVMGALGFSQVISHHIGFLLTYRAGWNWKNAATALIHDRLFYLNGGTLQGSSTSTGMMVNLISNDVSRFEEFAVYACFTWETPLEVIAVLVVLCFILDVPSAFAAVAASFVLIPVMIKVSKLFALYRGQTARATDQRVRYISEMIDGIASVKSYAWETPFFYLVRKLRTVEMNVISRSQLLRAVNQGVMFSMSNVAAFAAFAVYWGTGGTLTIPKVFATLSLLQLMRLSLGTMWLKSIEKGSEAIASCHRIEAFLSLAEEADKLAEEDGDDSPASARRRSTSGSGAPGTKKYAPVNNQDGASRPAAGSISSESGIELRNNPTFVPPTAQPQLQIDVNLPLISISTSSYYYGTDPSKPSLSDVQLSVSRGEVLMVVGPVGCGKSTLLAAVLGEVSMVPPANGATAEKRVISPSTSLAYCAQRPWILASSVKSNIALAGSHEGHIEENFKRPTHINAELYALAVESCLIVDDLAQWPAYDDTEVGERGISISGGQKARISLARAVYSDADLCILDDPLSAVDAHVGKALYFRCIQGALKKRNKGVILVTHQLQYLKHADKVLVLNKNGLQTFYGSYSELQKNSEVLSTLELSEHHASVTAAAEIVATVAEEGDGDTDSDSGSDAGGAVTKYDPNFRHQTLTKMKSYIETEADKKRRTVVEKEEQVEGQMSSKVYLDYLTAGGVVRGTVVIVTMVLSQVVSLIADYWLRWWASSQFGSQSENKYVIVFAVLMALCVIFGFVRALWWFQFTLRASANLHDNCMWAVMHSPSKFFVSNPTGRILNRFAKDQNQTDELLPITFFDFVQCAFFCLSAIVLICISIPWLILLFPFLMYAFLNLRNKYMVNSREIKRIEAVTRSPIYADFSATLEGLPTLRAYKLEERVAHLFQTQIDENGRAYFSFMLVSRWFGFRLDLQASLLVTFVAFFAVILRNSIDVGLIGFTLVYTIMLCAMFQWAVRQSAEVETQMTSVERINAYGQLPPEEGYTTTLEMVREQLGKQTMDSEASVTLDPHTKENIEKANRLNESKQGRLQLVNLTVKYRLDLDPVLKNITVDISAGSKVGICGRTGSGKSSTLLALLRLNIITEGDILLDGSSLLSLDLETARSLVSIIPQEPHLFSGTVRFNLDPFSIYTDEQIWSALKDAHIHEYISKDPLGLSSKVEEGGKNFSVGQRQLLSLARAILRRCKVVLMDEVTASIDFLTDRLIQETIRTSPALKDSTIVTVAHRLRTIADSDLIVVIQAGDLVEQGHPKELLTQPQSYFRKLADESNEFDEIVRIANKN